MASYNPPNPYVPGAFNPNQYITPSANITTQYLDENYLRFPFAQGAENFVSINNQGQLNQGGKAEFSSATIPVNFLLTPTITNPIADTAITPTNGIATIGYVLYHAGQGGDVYTDVANIFTLNNTFPSITLDNGIGTTQLTSNNNGSLLLSSSVNTLGVNFNLGNGTASGASLFPTSGGQLIAEVTSLVISGVSTNATTTLTPQDFNLDINTSITLPAQTTYNPLISYGNVASTQQFVQQAIASQGGGDVTTGGTNDFTGRNTFNYNLNGGTITASGLTLARNVETGYNEMDLVSINTTTNSGLNIYCETASVSYASTPKIQIYNDGTATLFNTPVQIAQGQTGTTYNYALLTTNNTTYVPTINFLYDSLQTLVVNQLGYFTQSYTLTASISPYITYNYSTSIYNTTQAANALVGFTLSTNGRASFSFSPNPVNNTYSNNCAYLQLNPPVWDNGANPVSMASFFNGSVNAYLMGIWNSATLLGTSTFPFLNSSSILNTHQTTFYSPVFEYNTGSQYSQTFSAQICSFNLNGVQNIALIVSALLPQTINPNMVVQIPPFQITF
jgi:hypothetical protein